MVAAGSADRGGDLGDDRRTGVSPGLAAVAFLGLAALRAAVDARALALAQRLSREVRLDLRGRLIGHSLRLAPQGGAEGPGVLASLMGEGVAQTGAWVERFRPAALRARVLPPVILLLALGQSWSAALALLLTGPLIPVFMALVGWAAEAASRAHLVETGALNRVLIDRVAALVDLRLLGAGSRAAADLDSRSDSLRRRTMKVLRLAFLSSATLEFFASLGVALVAVHVGLSLLGLIHWGAWGDGLTPFGGIFVLLIAPEFYQPLRDLAAAWHDRAAAEASGEAIGARLEVSSLILGTGRPAAVPAPRGSTAWTGLILAPGSGTVIAVPDGSVGPGEAVALVGLSGAGKSTLLATLAGLVPAARGEIRHGGQVLAPDTADAIRSRLALLPQAPQFPAASLRAFLTSGRAQVPDQALQAARIEAALSALPNGLATRLGETGGGLSGGEARRVLIARALIDRPALLLVDEPTADLDAATAAQVTEALLALRTEGTGLLVATHDPALIARLDRVIRIGGAA
ncbi:ATP-binding cassette domain-containing protein [Rhodobacter sp. Har01]|uniref:ATP-binding cassette domain-containing protein n=1 Tax=Rhodobacter sp. Har01 TaxID=2883999 RepID=UPI001D061E59|nr:ATP-binding cassette domain-containing protein [Rhodobacter sp. Har01]MCB6178091.1 ATP-binding cassette domain-containing protein [Rhodobacter sp. Har01]